jgi:hypothetical protein
LDTQTTPASEVAVAFASALVAGDFVRANAMLAPPLRQILSPEKLHKKLYGMFDSYADGDPKDILFDEDGGVMDWPPEFPNDLGSVYVGIMGDEFLEAVTVTVADIDGGHLIREIVWGRP